MNDADVSPQDKIPLQQNLTALISTVTNMSLKCIPAIGAYITCMIVLSRMTGILLRGSAANRCGSPILWCPFLVYSMLLITSIHWHDDKAGCLALCLWRQVMYMFNGRRISTISVDSRSITQNPGFHLLWGELEHAALTTWRGFTHWQIPQLTIKSVT